MNLPEYIELQGAAAERMRRELDEAYTEMCKRMASALLRHGESTTEMPANTGLTPADPRQSTMRGAE